MNVLIVTGLSGAGKSSCIKVLEDIGFFCVDNMPPQLIPMFAEICDEKNNENLKYAFVTDIRSGEEFLKLGEYIDKLRSYDHISVRLLFLEASKDVLMHRYDETRRKHPLDEVSGGNLSKAIDAETELLSNIRENADYIIDSSFLTAAQLKDQVAGLFLEQSLDRMIVSVMSFGFRYGVPSEADLVFDVRCLPNPFYVPELRNKTGIDEEVRDYVMKFPESIELEKKIHDVIDFMLPLCVKEGKSRLVIAFGCTGGHHRSITFAERTAAHLTGQGCNVRINHRDKNK